MKKNEKPYYFASTIVKGKVVKHEGDMKYAVYLSDIEQRTKRASRFHNYISKKYENAYDNLGVINASIYEKEKVACEEFMKGKRIK